MAKITPIPKHIALTMDVAEAESLVLCLDTLHSWAQEDMPEAITAFGQMLAGAVEALTDDAASLDDESATA